MVELEDEGKSVSCKVQSLDHPANYTDRDASNHRCQVCQGFDGEAHMLVCDSDQCGLPWHTYCIGLASVPAGDWHCPQCSSTSKVGQEEVKGGGKKELTAESRSSNKGGREEQDAEKKKTVALRETGGEVR